MSTSTNQFGRSDVGFFEGDAPVTQWQRTREASDKSYGRPHRRPNVGHGERFWSMAGGLGLCVYGLMRGKGSGLLATAAGAGLLYRGMSGHCYCYEALGVNTAEQGSATAVPAQQGQKIEKSITINRPVSEVFRQWRDLESLPRFMEHLKSVQKRDDKRSHWIARGVFGKDVEWDAEVINERENEMLAWRSLPGGDIETAGSVHVEPLTHGRGTQLTVAMKYNPPAGKIGAHVASWFGDGLSQKVENDLKRFKQVLEAGEVTTTLGQPHGSAPRR